MARFWTAKRGRRIEGFREGFWHFFEGAAAGGFWRGANGRKKLKSKRGEVNGRELEKEQQPKKEVVRG